MHANVLNAQARRKSEVFVAKATKAGKLRRLNAKKVAKFAPVIPTLPITVEGRAFGDVIPCI